MDYKQNFVTSPNPLPDGRHNSLLYTDFLSSNKELICKQSLGPQDTVYNLHHQNTLHDRSVQENLGPMFQPFGIDITRMPVTNPPIFQSSLPAFDQPLHKRRISISNGQISQLGEEFGTIENFYSCQASFPLSRAQQNHDPQQMVNSSTSTYPSFSSGELQDMVQPQTQTTIVPEVVPQTSNKNVYPLITPFDSNVKLNSSAIAATVVPPSTTSHIALDDSAISHAYNNMQPQLGAQRQTKIWKHAQLSVNPCTPASDSSVSSCSSCQNTYDHSNENKSIPSIHSSKSRNINNNTTNMASRNVGMINATDLPYESKPSDLILTDVYSNSSNDETISTLSNSRKNEILSHSKHITSSTVAPMCTTASSQIEQDPRLQKISSNTGDFEDSAKAWKRARLLERNRIAASKCRQRKKMSQLQLRKEFDQLSEENIIMKKKLEYYEKLVQKMKRFSRLHMQECTSKVRNNGSGKFEHRDRGTNAFLKIIEEMISSSTLEDE